MTSSHVLQLFTLALVAAAPSLARGARETTVMYLNFDGATLQSGPDDARNDTSQICSGEYPPYGWGIEEAVVQAVKHNWERWNIEIVTERPTEGDYTMAMIGPKTGCFDGAGGVAPKDCMNGNPNNVVFSFAVVNDPVVESTVISQEVAHSFGLEHVTDPMDIMYPTAGAGDPEFVDACTAITGSAVCGDQHTMVCGNFLHQNSFAELDIILGLAIPDMESPLVAIVDPIDGESFAPGATVAVEAEASDDKDVAQVSLWLDGVEQEVDATPPFAWDVAGLADGTYTFEAVAKDAAGNEATSAPVTITVGARGETGGDGSTSGDGEADSGDEGDGSDGGASDGGGSEGGDPGAGMHDPDDASSGCGCTSSGSDAPVLCGLVGFFGWLRRRASIGAAALATSACGGNDSANEGSDDEQVGDTGGSSGATTTTDGDASTGAASQDGGTEGDQTSAADDGTADGAGSESTTEGAVEGELVVVDAGVTATLRAVRFADDTHVWAVGDEGTMITSADAGASWTVAPAITDGRLRSIAFVDASTGWAVGEGDAFAPPVIYGHILPGNGLKAGTILRTTDGETWTKSWYTGANFELHCVRMVSAQVGQLCDYGADFHRDGDTIVTHDGGENWALERAFRGLNDAFWRDESTAWAVGTRVSVGFSGPRSDLLTDKDARILATVDGGTSWATQASPLPPNDDDQLFGVWFADGETGVAVGDSGTIVRTTDAGATWSSADAGVDASLRSVVFVSASQGFVVGTGGTFLQTLDGGASWSALDSPTASDLLQVHAPAGLGPVAVGSDGIVVRMQ